MPFPARFACLLALCAAAPALAAQDEQLWFNGTVTGTAKGDLLYFVEVQPRFGDRAGGLDQLLLRPAVGWRVSPAVSLYLGYARVITTVADARDRREDRLFQQISWSLGTLAGGTVSARTRFEQRRLRGSPDTGWRVRQMLRFVRPLAASEKVRALVSVEPFVAFNDTDWGARTGFDQLRTFVGVEVPLTGRSTVELGYLSHVVDQAAGRWRVNHVAAINLFIRP